jgi:hypothetical protein
MPIIEYANRVFTNEGQGTVQEFGTKLALAEVAVQKAGNITVYVGYHADTDGRFVEEHDGDEAEAVQGMSARFPLATLHRLDVEMPDEDIRQAVDAGGVFFTWCDSDTRVKTIMGTTMPAEVARHG